MTTLSTSIKIDAPIEKVYAHLTDFTQVSGHLPIMHRRDDARGGPHPSWCVKHRTVAWDSVSGYYHLGGCAEDTAVNVDAIEYELQCIDEQTTRVRLTAEYAQEAYALMMPLRWFVLRGILKNALRDHKATLEHGVGLDALPAFE